jgi:alkylhydroperoxidase family enzyme
VGLLRASEDSELIEGLKHNPRTVSVTPRHRALLDYVIVLTETPWAVEEKHVQAMREQGYSDQAIAVANLTVGFFSWCNRVIDGMGLPLEEIWPEEIRAKEHAVKSTAAGTPERAAALSD